MPERKSKMVAIVEVTIKAIISFVQLRHLKKSIA